jgi:hypothetical protein
MLTREGLIRRQTCDQLIEACQQGFGVTGNIVLDVQRSLVLKLLDELSGEAVQGTDRVPGQCNVILAGL